MAFSVFLIDEVQLCLNDFDLLKRKALQVIRIHTWIASYSWINLVKRDIFSF